MVRQTIGLWVGDLTANEEKLTYYRQYLNPSEQRQAELFTRKAALIAYVESHARVRLLLSGLLECNPKTLRIGKTEYGKPYLPDYSQFTYNISHTADKLIVAAGFRCLLGVDIEIIKPRKNLSGLVNKCFACEEQNYWRQLPDLEQVPAFYRYWTRKEAVVKATGRGIALGLNTFAIDPDNPAKLLTAPEAYGPAEAWQLHDFDINATICGALAVKTDVMSDGYPIKISWHTLV